MIGLGLTPIQQAQCVNLLQSHHSINIIVRLLTTNHTYVEDLSHRFLDGTVTIDATASEADRALDMVLLDPSRLVQLDPDSPSGGAVFITNMISVIYNITSPLGDLSFNIPVFCGPIDQVERTGPFLTIKCLGKEVLSSDPLWVGRTFSANWAVTSIIRTLLAEAGESASKLDIARLPNLRPYPLALKRGDLKPWAVARWLASTLGQQLFYDGRGVAVMRASSTKPVFTFHESNMKGQPHFGYDLKTASNAFLVTGGIPKGSKTPLSRALIAPDDHPLSPKRVGRNGKDRFLNPIFVDDQTLTTRSLVDNACDRIRTDALLEAITTTAEAMPNPLLEPLDVCHFNWDGFALDNRVEKLTIPLKNTGSTTIGYLRRTRTVGKQPIRMRG